MPIPRSFRVVLRIAGVVAAIGCIVGSVILLALSDDAMPVLIHWIGEERVLGSQNVYHNPDGSVLLTNPGAMAKVVLMIWGIGLSQAIAGGFLLWKSVGRGCRESK